MKKLVNYISIIALCALATVSCDNTITTPPSEYEELSRAKAVYYGDTKGTDTGFFELTLSDGNATEGHTLYLEIFGSLIAEGDDIILHAGDYSVGTGDIGTFIAGDGETGSLYTVAKTGEKTTLEITGGTFSIELTGTTYLITTSLKDADGNDIKCMYEGPINITDESVLYEPVVMTSAAAVYFGNREGETNGFFELTLNEGTAGTGHKLFIQLYGDPQDDSVDPAIKTGTYQLGNGDPLTYVKGSGSLGTLYTVTSNGSGATSAITGGTFTIEREGTNYSITTSLTDNNGSNVDVVYEGAITIDDRSEPIVQIIAFTDAEGTYLGNVNDNRTGQFDLKFTAEEGGVEYELILSVLSEMVANSANATLAINTFRLNETMSVYTIMPSIEAAGDYTVSALNVTEGATTSNYGFTEGFMRVEQVEGNNYKITFNLMKTDETRFRATFDGSLVCTDESSDRVYSTLTRDIDLEGSFFGGHGEIYFYGTSRYPGYNTRETFVYSPNVSEKGTVGTGEYMRFVYCTPDSSDDEGGGIFNFVSDSARHMIPGDGATGEGCFYYQVEDGVVVGSAPLVNGSVEVIIMGENTVNFLFRLIDDHVPAYDVTGVVGGSFVRIDARGR